MAHLPRGKLVVLVIEARDLKNKDGLFGKNDPFIKLKLDKFKEKTSTKRMLVQKRPGMKPLRCKISAFLS
ncbi:hypothetical protein DSO57_1035501 [Entomophthora muscae]|uniref:Uncharacterized protein n=1 Tax=Entomophthora muscae TaxID=34485 RepID=A0ACC2REE8_9FUNG|nr:hypothetical protein DSO57_1035501 [Entomophthora muscae]